jgi:hypothetical protein
MSLRSFSLFAACLLFAGSLSAVRAEEPAEPSAKPADSGSASCCEMCSCPVSPWEGSAGFVLLQRSNPPSRDIARGLNDLPNQTIDAGQFGFQYEVGPELTVLRHCDCADIEFRWFQVNDFMSQSATVHDSFGFGFPFRYLLGVTGNGVDVSAQYLSQLSNFELNFKRPVNDCITVFAGLRFVELNERLTINSTPGGGDPLPIFVRSFNDLYGFQLGSDITVWDRGGPFRLLTTCKAGVYSNFTRNRADNGEENSTYEDSASATHAAFLGELGVFGTYQITKRLSARLGYEVMCLDGVALAPEQQPRLDPAHDPDDYGSPSVATCGTVLYHGVVGNLEFRF